MAIRPGLLTNYGVIESWSVHHKDELSHGDRDSPGSMGASGPTGYLGPLPSECRYGRKSDTPNESMAISGAREASTTANDVGVMKQMHCRGFGLESRY